MTGRKDLTESELSLTREGMRRLKRDTLALMGFAVLLLFALLSILAPFIAPYGRDIQNLAETYKAPGAGHLLGTDELGRDIFTRLLYGGRVSLTVGLASTAITVALGITFGAISGYFGGIWDSVIMRLTDIFMCFPFYVIAITCAAVFGAGIMNVILISGFLNWTGICRLVRAEVLALKQLDYMEAAKAQGIGSLVIILHHIIPNVLPIVIVNATLGVADGILSEAGLSYLGLGVAPPTPSWGNMLAAAQNLRVLRGYWWLWVPAGACVCITILAINFLGDGLRNALDPKSE